MADAETIGANIRAWRIKKGLTQSKLGELIGIQSRPQQQMSLWEYGHRKPKYETLMKLATVLECQVSDLLGEDIS